jgi:hypothetical protein
MRKRALLIAILMMTCLLLAGCARTWFVDFTRLHSVDDWVKFGPWSALPEGLVLGGGYISSKVAFGGDFTLTVIFDLDVDDLLNRAEFAIWLSDGQTLTPDNYITCIGLGLGDPLEEEYTVRDYSQHETEERYIADYNAAFPGLIRQGLNTWKLIKEGKHIDIWMNGNVEVASFDIEHYEASYFYVNIHGDTEGAGILAFRSCKVVYYDYMLP